MTQIYRITLLDHFPPKFQSPPSHSIARTWQSAQLIRYMNTPTTPHSVVGYDVLPSYKRDTSAYVGGVLGKGDIP
jgi:hypothetical protein